MKIDLTVTQMIKPAIDVWVSDDLSHWKLVKLHSIDHRLPYPYASHNNRYSFAEINIPDGIQEVTLDERATQRLIQNDRSKSR